MANLQLAQIFSFSLQKKKKNLNILSYNCYIGKITKTYINQIFILMTSRDGPTILSYQRTGVKKKKTPNRSPYNIKKL